MSTKDTWSLGAVSYTHLDVYKRQERYLLSDSPSGGRKKTRGREYGTLSDPESGGAEESWRTRWSFVPWNVQQEYGKADRSLQKAYSISGCYAKRRSV